MWLCDHPHGSVLVHRVHASGCDCLTARRPVPDDGHHEGRRCKVLIYTSVLNYVTTYSHVKKKVCRIKINAVRQMQQHMIYSLFNKIKPKCRSSV